MKAVYFYIAFGIFLFIYLARWFHLQLPQWMYSYVNDFLCLPIVLHITLVVIRYIKKDTSILLNWYHIISIAFLFTVYFEWYLPKNNSRYTADWVDVLLYFLGGFLFFVLQRKDDQY
ncbi:hypothetical protein J2X31_001234 [Flavobacterium arsenatis]|uniref:Magnesium citrate secondary transporter n=1 Tax=Flavobacterium arsenatis TaxID=1484332 RepID=A0ABU1TN47_9FLAO|nr:hypothetical protein [Flavobacterium arsenatis]